MKKFLLPALAVLALTTACKKDDSPATPTAMQVSGTLSGANSIPANASPATGSMTGTFDKASRVLTYNIAFANLTGPAMMAHLHFGDAKHVNPVPTVPFAVPSPNVATGTIAGSATLTPQQADSLVAGKIYANIHTNKYMAGEIRSTVVVK